MKKAKHSLTPENCPRCFGLIQEGKCTSCNTVYLKKKIKEKNIEKNSYHFPMLHEVLDKYKKRRKHYFEEKRKGNKKCGK